MKCHRTYNVSEPFEPSAQEYFRVGLFLGFLLGAIVTLSLVSAVALILFR